MKALTLRQPWATLVALGEKRVETRSWQTSYRGPLAIHAAGNTSPLEDVLCYEPQVFKALAAHGIPFCTKRSVDGLLLSEHIAFWIVTWHADSANPRDFRWRWYCRTHLPARYKQAVLEAMDTVEELLIAKGES